MRLQHFAEAGDASSGECLDRSGGDGVDPYVLFAQIVRQVAHGGFQSRLSHSHHVIVRHHLFGAKVGERNYAAPLAHQRSGGARQRNQRVDADLVRNPEALAAGHHELVAQLFGGSIGDRVDERVNSAVAALQLLEQRINLAVARDIALEGVSGQAQNHLLGFLPDALVLIRDGQLGSGGLKRLCDGPGNAAFVGDPEHHGRTVFQRMRHWQVLTPAAIG